MKVATIDNSDSKALPIIYVEKPHLPRQSRNKQRQDRRIGFDWPRVDSVSLGDLRNHSESDAFALYIVVCIKRLTNRPRSTEAYPEHEVL